MRVLKQEYANSAWNFAVVYDGESCTCWQSAPCGWCTHRGNPINLEETPEAWEEVYDIGSVPGEIKSEFHLRYLLDATRTFGGNVLHLSMTAYSVSKALGA